MQHKEIRHEISKTRLKAIEALRVKDVYKLRECMRKLQELDHKLYDE